MYVLARQDPKHTAQVHRTQTITSLKSIPSCPTLHLKITFLKWPIHFGTFSHLQFFQNSFMPTVSYIHMYVRIRLNLPPYILFSTHAINFQWCYSLGNPQESSNSNDLQEEMERFVERLQNASDMECFIPWFLSQDSMLRLVRKECGLGSSPSQFTQSYAFQD